MFAWIGVAYATDFKHIQEHLYKHTEMKIPHTDMVVINNDNHHVQHP